MSTIFSRWLMLAAAGLGLAACASMPPGETADAVFLGGPIYTANDESPMAEAVAIRGQTIVYVGDERTARRMARSDDAIIDLGGAALYPGFTDAHAHLIGIGQRELTLNLEDTGSLADLVARVGAEVAKTPEGRLIFGRGWIETHWPEGRFPVRADLDAVSPNHPVLLIRADGHALVANSKALEMAGVTADTPDPDGGQILRDASGEPTGMLIDNAETLVAGLMAEPTEADKLAAIAKAAEVYIPRGWTGLHAMSVDPDNVALIEQASGDGSLPLRAYLSINPPGGPALFEKGPRKTENGRVITRAVKLYVDGALGSRGAALLEPYSDAEGTGLLLMRKDEALPFLRKALAAGIQINTHAIGDKGNRLVLDWYEESFAAVPPGDRAVPEPRWRIEHAQVLDPDDIPRFAELGVIASMQPSHAIGDLHFAPSRLGEDRLVGAYAWKSLVESGAIIAGGSDAPVEKGDPLIEFYATVARRDLEGFSGPGWHPEEALDRQTALKLFTLWPAYASFQEDTLGSIEPGKQADFTVFSADIMTIPEDEIPQAKAVMTVIGGAIVHTDFDF